MKRFVEILIFITLAITSTRGTAQVDAKNICTLRNDRIVININLNWTPEKIKEIMNQFGIDSLVLEKAQQNIPQFVVDSITWYSQKIGNNLVEISKSWEQKPFDEFILNEVLLIDDALFWGPGKPQQTEVTFGWNSGIREKYFKAADTTARFFLEGYQKASKVYLAGSFNNWSTMGTPMKFVDTGWIADIRLSPGKYTYKYIVDGKWTLDPNNRSKEKDGNGNTNSVVYMPNFTFRLKGYTNARTVILAGSFNNWDEKSVRMEAVPYGWMLRVYLKEGTHTYKYIVDREWITDPGNPMARNDGRGNINSVMATGDTMVFRLRGFTSASRVELAGSFNHWQAGELLMQPDGEGWHLPYVLGKGNYEYKFIVDGKWMPDPENSYTTGGGEFTNSWLAFKPNHLFTLNGFSEARQVIVTGSFNGWKTNDYRMVKSGENWIFPVYLSPGKHLYKLIVDGEWITDPGNPLTEQNEHGTGNSVLWVQP